MANGITLAPTSTNSTLNLRIPDDAGDAPRERMPGVLDAYGIASVLMQASKDRWRKMAMIKGQFDGNPPFNPAALRRQGMAYYPNFNSLEAKAYRSSALAPYYDAFASAPTLADIQLALPDKSQQDEASRIVMEETDYTLRAARWFSWDIEKCLCDYVGMGKGYLFWGDPFRLSFQYVPQHRVLFPDMTDVNMEDWDIFGVLQLIDPTRLYKAVRERGRAMQQGWKPDAVLQAIRNNAAPYDPSLYDDYVGLQQQLKDHDLYVTARVDKVWCMHIYVREYDNTWTHAMVALDSYQGQPQVPPERPGSAAERVRGKAYREDYIDMGRPAKRSDGSVDTADNPVDSKNGFLFYRRSQYSALSHIIAPFFFEVLDGSINGISGLGKDIFAPMQLKDRFWCARTNNAFLRSTVVIQPQDARSREKLQLMQVQNVTIVPPGVTVQPGTIFGDMAAATELNADFDRMLTTNTGIYRASFEKPSGNPEPATNFMMRAQQSTTLSSSAQTKFFLQMDAVYEEIYRRLRTSNDEAAVAWRRRLADRGIDRATLAKVRYVRAYRTMGSGSVFLRQQQLGTLLTPAVFGHLPADGQARLIQDVIGSVAGQQKVERYMPIDQREDHGDRNVWEATIENDALRQGAPVITYPAQDAVVHLATHAKAGQETLQGVRANPQIAAGAAAFLQGLCAHAAEHIRTLLDNGRKVEAKPFVVAFAKLNKAATDLSKAVMSQMQQQRAQQQRTQQAATDAQLAQAKAAQDMHIKDAKARQALAIKAATARQKLGVGAALAQQKLASGHQAMALADASTAAGIHRQRFAALAAAQAADDGDGDGSD